MQEKKEHKEKKITYFDYNLLFILIVLIGFGLVMLYSSSSYTAINSYGDSAYYVKKQLFYIALGTIPMVILAIVDYRIWKKCGFVVYVLAFIMCCAVYIPHVGVSSHGSARWIRVFGVSFQPSELAKIAVVLFLAMLIERVPKSMKSFRNIIVTLATLIPIVGVVAYSNLSTAIIILGIAVCMLFVSSPSYKPFLIIAGMGVIFVFAFIMLQGYRMGRLEAWLHPETAGDSGYQTLMGLYAIGSGELFGKGLGNSMQKMGHVPESQNDMIFSIICEELGLFGAICVILLYLLLIWRMMVIANNARDLHGSLIVAGIMAHISLQVILNIAVVTNSIPNTGVTLPFISYGGSSIVLLMSEMGLVLGISRGIRLETIN